MQILKSASHEPEPFDLPCAETLDGVVKLILMDENATFGRLQTVEQRIQVVKLAQEAERMAVLRNIEEDLDELRKWFKASRTYEGR